MTAVAAPSWRTRPGLVVGLCVLVYLPFTLLGYGTDLDVANVLRAGRSWIDDGDYQMSRGPGRGGPRARRRRALDRVGGSVLVNLVTLAFVGPRHVERLPCSCVGTAVGGRPGPCWCWPATRGSGSRRPRWATTCGRSACCWPARWPPSGDRRVLAGVLFGLADRVPGLVRCSSWWPGWSPRSTGRPGDAGPTCRGRALGGRRARGRRRVLRPPVARCRPVLRLPRERAPVRRVRRPPRPLGGEEPGAGRRARGVVLLVGLPKLMGALDRWSASTIVRFAVFATVASEVLYFRFPFKPMHLLPVVAASPCSSGRRRSSPSGGWRRSSWPSSWAAWWARPRRPRRRGRCSLGSGGPERDGRPPPHRRALPPRRPRAGPLAGPPGQRRGHQRAARQRRLSERHLARPLTPDRGMARPSEVPATVARVTLRRVTLCTALALAVASCTGGDDPEGAPTTTVTVEPDHHHDGSGAPGQHHHDRLRPDVRRRRGRGRLPPELGRLRRRRLRPGARRTSPSRGLRGGVSWKCGGTRSSRASRTRRAALVAVEHHDYRGSRGALPLPELRVLSAMRDSISSRRTSRGSPA